MVAVVVAVVDADVDEYVVLDVIVVVVVDVVVGADHGAIEYDALVSTPIFCAAWLLFHHSKTIAK